MECTFEPAMAYEREMERREREYILMVRYATCADCEHGIFPDEKMYTDPDVEWCPVIGEFVRATDSPLDEGCDDFDPRPEYDYQEHMDGSDYDAMQRKSFCYHPGI